MNRFAAFLLGIILGVSALNAEQQVEVAKKPGEKFSLQKTLTLADVPSVKVDSGLDKFGGVIEPKQKATGFFRVENINGRWWIIDPVGGRFIHRGLASVNTIPTDGAREEITQKFKNKEGWARATAGQLIENGFNGTGSWTDDSSLEAVEPRLVSTKLISLMASYGKTKGAKMGTGNMSYPGDCPPIFDSEFSEFCKKECQKLCKDKNDPWLLGYFTDNEMPWKLNLLDKFLKLSDTDHGRIAAEAWLVKNKVSKEKITDENRSAFLEYAADAYFKIATSAIRTVDSNHMILGARFHSAAYNFPAVFIAAGRYCDMISVNYYGAWTPNKALMDMWLKNAQKPFIITEWYAKAEDSGMGNTGGAGWLVHTQKDRGMYYQNFTLSLLKHPGCVGWHWFKYADNDPDAKGVDPSNLDSNKGIVTARYVPYAPLLEAMRELNQRTYGLIEVMDKTK